ncbi:MarR family winged helix-turn-helix transcriptional regulator [Streptomyces sp. NBC_01433]|uniref:MarR family winged helix-turn-helix transcriptional regulator n=1 Tax=Streptomyces sp. NBC_01433 TaxID=2903864 RepID=UPI0022549469|nr:MarR family winged helix-turn-helix transcriptional regulator [Streptomyces sp. NBC_01433]MCX4676087.1 MarR family winged helix-turn-helix transcriptional regulator [Streptomyces sp. NBC_01433]
MEKRPGLALAFAGQIAGMRVQEAVRAHGIKNNQAHVLMVLADQGATGQQALAQTLGVDPSMLVAMLNDLEDAGLAERRRDPADRRRHIVEISPRGTRLVTDIYDGIASAEAELFSALDADELDVLHKMLIRIRTTGGEPSCDAADTADTPDSL